MLTNFKTFDITDFYWFVAGDTTQVFSSASLCYFPSSNATYAGWKAAGHTTTHILDKASLLEVLNLHLMPKILTTGIVVTSTETPTLNGTYPLDAVSLNQISGIATSITAGRGLPGGGNAFMYKGKTFTAENFMNYAVAAESYVYAAYQALDTIVYTGTGNMPSNAITIA